MGSVNLKGTASGIILELDSKVDFEVLITEITQKFNESRSFLGRASMGLWIKGRTVNDSEIDRILFAITENCNIKINCVLCDDPELNRVFESYAVKANAESIYENSCVNNDPAPAQVAEPVTEEPSFELEKGAARIYASTLRSGQSLTDKRSIVVLGDVKPGATVTSEGSIIVMGALRGSAYAGAAGDEKAFVIALELDPLQIRIANAIAISPDSEKGPRLKMRKFRKPAAEKKTEVAYILNGHVVKDIYGLSFLRDNRIME